jgi:hypothetical protein
MRCTCASTSSTAATRSGEAPRDTGPFLPPWKPNTLQQRALSNRPGHASGAFTALVLLIDVCSFVVAGVAFALVCRSAYLCFFSFGGWQLRSSRERTSISRIASSSSTSSTGRAACEARALVARRPFSLPQQMVEIFSRVVPPTGAVVAAFGVRRYHRHARTRN